MKLELREFLRAGSLGSVQVGTDLQRSVRAGISTNGETWLRFIGTGDKVVVDLRLVVDAGEMSTEDVIIDAKRQLREMLSTLVIG